MSHGLALYAQRRATIVNILHHEQWMTTAEVAAHTPWSTLTVGQVLDALLKRRSVEMKQPGGASTERLWRLSEWVAIDLGLRGDVWEV